MRGVSSFNVGTIAGREPVAMMMRSKVSDSCDAVGLRDAQRRRVLERGAALHVVHLALLRENAESAGELLDDIFFPRTQARQIDLRRGELDAPIFGLMRFLQQLGHVEQRLRRNAAAVKADSAGVQFGVDQRDVHAEIGGKKCSGISTRTAAHHCNVQRLVFQTCG